MAKKKLVKSMIDYTPGAVYIAKDSSGGAAHVSPASLGICKKVGCIEFAEQPKDADCPNDAMPFNDQGYILEDDKSDEVYFDHCEKEEAWLVFPHANGKDWRWHRVDHKLELLDE